MGPFTHHHNHHLTTVVPLHCILSFPPNLHSSIAQIFVLLLAVFFFSILSLLGILRLASQPPPIFKRARGCHIRFMSFIRP